ncbi:MAG TPA: MarR family transcriptional regulator [Candidatus Limnocylindrales bacterium]
MQTESDLPQPPAAREAMIRELVEEMTSWSPKDRVHVFRSWLKGSLSLIHLHVLTVLEIGGPLPMSKLADTLDVSVASATGIVSRMEERELVERQHDAEDRRVVLVIPTETGLAVFRDMMEQRREHLTGLLMRLDDDELQAFLTGLRAVRAAREELHQDPSPDSPIVEPAATEPVTPPAPEPGATE